RVLSSAEVRAAGAATGSDGGVPPADCRFGGADSGQHRDGGRHDFFRAGESVTLTAKGRKRFLRADEQRMDTLVTHPIFQSRVSYRRVLEIQARLLARVVNGELHEYPGFETR